MEQTERAEHDDSTVAGSEGIGTGNKVLLPMELKTDGTEDGQSEDRYKIASGSQEKSDTAAGSSDSSHAGDLGYIEGAYSDVSNRNCHDLLCEYS